MAKRKASEAWDLKLTDEQKVMLADDLCREVQESMDARNLTIKDGGKIDYWNWLYEQGRSQPKDLPFPGAADLNSYLPMQSVDAMRARLMTAAYSVQPLCTAEVYGDNAGKAPAIEEFHQWQQREEGLPAQLGLLVHLALIEEGGIIEVRERIETKRTVEERTVAVQVGENGAAMFDDQGAAMLQRGDDGDFVDMNGGPDASLRPTAKISHTRTQTKRLGPEYEIISFKNFGYLPAHAQNHRQVWGYYKRFYARKAILDEQVLDKQYDAEAVKGMGDTGNRSEGSTPGSVDSIQRQIGPSSEFELFELSLKRDLDEDGREEWYVITLDLVTRAILRCKLDTFAMKAGRRCVPFIPCPRSDSVYGYSYVDKLAPTAEEHAALRNSTADKNAMAVSAPFKVMNGASWDPSVEPFGVGRTIHVNSMDEVEQMIVADVPQSSIFLLRDIMQANERISGLSDVGVIGSGDRQSTTLGQDELVASASNIRVSEFGGHLSQTIAEVMQLRQAIWIDALESNQQGLEAPAGVIQALQQRGAELPNGRFTADMLKARVWFNAYGTTDTANAGKRIQYWMQGIEALVHLGQVVPPIAMAMQSPEVAQSLVDETLQVFKVRNRQPWVKALRQVFAQQQLAASIPQPGGMQPGAPAGPPQPGGPPSGPQMPPGGPGMPPGAPPMGGPGRVLPFPSGGPGAN